MRIIKGSSLRSEFVDANRSYASKRTIDVLANTVTLSSAAKTLANDIDRFAPHSSSSLPLSSTGDGKISIDELVLLENDQERFGSLTDDDNSALSEIWDALIMPAAAAMASAVEGVESLNSVVVDHETIPYSELPKTRVAVDTDVPQEMREWARWIQRRHDDDQDPSTISPADSKAVLDDPWAGLTCPQRNFVGELHSKLLDVDFADIDAREAKASIPGIGTTEVKIDAAGSTDVVLVENRRLIESRSAGINKGKLTHVRTQLILKVDRQIQLNVPLGLQGVLFHGDNEIELHPGPNRLAIEVAEEEEVLIGLFNDSGPVEMMNVKLPWFGQRDEDLTSYLGYEFIGADDESLHRNLVDISSGGGEVPARLAAQLESPSWIATHFEYDSAAKRPPERPATVPDDLLSRLASNQGSSLPPGKYETKVSVDRRQKPLIIDVFASGLVRATFLGATSTLRPSEIHADEDESQLAATLSFRNAGYEDCLALQLKGDTLSYRIRGSRRSKRLVAEDRVF